MYKRISAADLSGSGRTWNLTPQFFVAFLTMKRYQQFHLCHRANKQTRYQKSTTIGRLRMLCADFTPNREKNVQEDDQLLITHFHLAAVENRCLPTWGQLADTSCEILKIPPRALWVGLAVDAGLEHVHARSHQLTRAVVSVIMDKCPNAHARRGQSTRGPQKILAKQFYCLLCSLLIAYKTSSGQAVAVANVTATVKYAGTCSRYIITDTAVVPPITGKIGSRGSRAIPYSGVSLHINGLI